MSIHEISFGSNACLQVEYLFCSGDPGDCSLIRMMAVQGGIVHRGRGVKRGLRDRQGRYLEKATSAESWSPVGIRHEKWSYGEENKGAFDDVDDGAGEVGWDHFRKAMDVLLAS